MNSGTVLTGSVGLTSITLGTRMNDATGARSRNTSQLRLLGGEIAGGADPVLDHELLPEALGEPLSHQARGEVAAAAGRKADDEPHRPRRITLPPSDAGSVRQL